MSSGSQWSTNYPWLEDTSSEKRGLMQDKCVQCKLLDYSCFSRTDEKAPSQNSHILSTICCAKALWKLATAVPKGTLGGSPKLGIPFGGHYSKDCSIVRSILRPPKIFWKATMCAHKPRVAARRPWRCTACSAVLEQANQTVRPTVVIESSCL